MRSLLQDIHYGIRVLRKKPGFTLIAVLTLALGIGANTAIFSAINAVLFGSLPYPDAKRLVVVNSSNTAKGFTRFGASFQDYVDWKEQNTVFFGIAAYDVTAGNLVGGAQPRRVQYVMTTADLFSVLGVAPMIGRDFTPEEDGPGRDRVVILSYRYWQEHFGNDRNVIGSSLTLGDKPVTVVGVMPQGFAFPDVETQMWKPIGMTPDQSGTRGSRWLATIARLKPDATLTQAQTEMRAIAGRLSAQYPASNQGWGLLVEGYQDLLVKDVRRQLLLLWGSVGLVMLIACANVANLLLVRAGERCRELAVRAALGAARPRLIRQLLTESLILALAGCGLGLLLAEAGLDVLKLYITEIVPGAHDLVIDLRILIYSIGISLAAAIGFGLLPAFKASKIDLTESLKDGARASTGASGRRLRGLLVVGEVALAVVIAVGAGLLIRSFLSLLNVNLGFDPTNVLTLRVAPPFVTTPEGKDETTFLNSLMDEKRQAGEFYRDLIARLEALPGVVSAGAVNRLPLTGNWWVEGFAIEGRLPANRQDMNTANGRTVNPGYFETMRVRLLEGRTLEEADDEDVMPVVVINQTAARRYWGDANPLGQRLTLDYSGRGATHWYTVVGIVGDERHNNLETEPRPILYFTIAQTRSGFGGDWGMDVVVKARANPLALIGAVRAQVRAMNPGLPVFNIYSMEQIVARNVAERRSLMFLLGFLALTAVLLAAVGIYGVISYSVSLRAREIGIRLALGAQSVNIFKKVIGQGLSLAMLGAAIGLTTAVALTRFLENLLFGVAAVDLATYTAVTGLFVLVTLLACYIPARRATKIDPIEALRCE